MSESPHDRVGLGPRWRRWLRSPIAWKSVAALALLATSQWWLAESLLLMDEVGLANLSSQRTEFAQTPLRQRALDAFDLSAVTIPRGEIRSGGPPKDGIPALSNPKLLRAGEAKHMQPSDRVVGVERGRDARAYPLKILNYHEIVNDRIGGMPVAVTYCPLCDSVAVFDRRTELGEREFGVSGLLYNSNVLMYDRGSEESLWSQLKAKGISGPGAGRSLRSLPAELTTWSQWVARHPNTQVLSLQTGHDRDYRRNPYAGYFDRPGLMFPVDRTDDRLPEKERVLGVWTEGTSRAYPISAFGDEPMRLEERIADKRIVIEFSPAARSLRVVQADDGVEWMYSLWFSWYAFRPETEIFVIARE